MTDFAASARVHLKNRDRKGATFLYRGSLVVCPSFALEVPREPPGLPQTRAVPAHRLLPLPEVSGERSCLPARSQVEKEPVGG